MKKSYYDDLRDFHSKFGLPIDVGEPTILADTVFLYRYQFLQEELQEMISRGPTALNPSLQTRAPSRR